MFENRKKNNHFRIHVYFYHFMFEIEKNNHFRIHVHRSKVVLNGVKKMSANSFSVLYQVGPSNPFKTRQMSAVRNTLSGFAEAAHVSNFEFENQRRTFHSYGRQCVCN